MGCRRQPSCFLPSQAGLQPLVQGPCDQGYLPGRRAGGRMEPAPTPPPAGKGCLMLNGCHGPKQEGLTDCHTMLWKAKVGDSTDRSSPHSHTHTPTQRGAAHCPPPSHQQRQRKINKEAFAPTAACYPPPLHVSQNVLWKNPFLSLPIPVLGAKPGPYCLPPSLPPPFPPCPHCWGAGWQGRTCGHLRLSTRMGAAGAAPQFPEHLQWLSVG